MRATKAPSKMEIGRRPDRRTEVSELAHIDIVNNLATGKKPPREPFFGAIYRNITPKGRQTTGNHQQVKAIEIRADVVTCLGFLAGKWGGSGFPDALLPLKSDFRLNPNDLAQKEKGVVNFSRKYIPIQRGKRVSREVS